MPSMPEIDTKVDPKATNMSGSALDALKAMTKVVADTGDFEQLKQFHPVDATTNPSLILQAVKLEAYKYLVDESVEAAKKAVKDPKNPDMLIPEICDQLLTAFGSQIVSIVPGVVSIEVDASLSFDKQASMDRARNIINMFKAKGVGKDRILIKLAATWEGCQAAKELQKEGINCNLTLMFSMCQAIAAAEAGAYLISPFVGRILDWYKKSTGKDYEASEDPGVESVRAIYAYYKKHGYKTVVMGASFRNSGEILQLAGCDNLTISPKLLSELSQMPASRLVRMLEPKSAAASCKMDKMEMTEARFRWMLNQDQMATDKLSEGIRGFDSDWNKLKTMLRETYCS